MLQLLNPHPLQNKNKERSQLQAMGMIGLGNLQQRIGLWVNQFIKPCIVGTDATHSTGNDECQVIWYPGMVACFPSNFDGPFL
mmetsp:Transcript_26267/g.60380  ORF Transcript_26267/g.60380 Transcript_26267/m.60380 type:complete len:83 (+) Transcript_26267:46-294(+)